MPGNVHPRQRTLSACAARLDRMAAAFSGLIIGSLLASGGVTSVAIFIGTAMLVGIAMIALFGPSTNGLALER
jgi:putative MFS transporter